MLDGGCKSAPPVEYDGSSDAGSRHHYGRCLLKLTTMHACVYNPFIGYRYLANKDFLRKNVTKCGGKSKTTFIVKIH